VRKSNGTKPTHKNVEALILALSLMSVAGVAHARFVRGMSELQLSQEVKIWLASGKTLKAIAKATHGAGLKPEQVASSLIESGQKPAEVVATLIKVDPHAARKITVTALTLKPAQAAVITAAAIAVVPQQSRAIIFEALAIPGVDPSEVLSATAVGGVKGSGGNH